MKKGIALGFGFRRLLMSIGLIVFVFSPLVKGEGGSLVERKIAVAAIQDLKFHMSSGKISFTAEKGASYELHPPAGTRESRIDIGIRLLTELRRATHLSVTFYVREDGESVFQPHSWVFHYEPIR